MLEQNHLAVSETKLSIEKMRLKGKGVRDTKGVCGDEYVTIEIEVPKTLTKEEKEALKAYQAAENRRQGSRASS